jgi:COMPASS component SWD1
VGLPETIEEYLEGPHPAVSLAFNPFGSLLATGCQDGQVLIWDYETRGVARTFVRHA